MSKELELDLEIKKNIENLEKLICLVGEFGLPQTEDLKNKLQKASVEFFYRLSEAKTTETKFEVIASFGRMIQVVSEPWGRLFEKMKSRYRRENKQ